MTHRDTLEQKTEKDKASEDWKGGAIRGGSTQEAEKPVWQRITQTHKDTINIISIRLSWILMTLLSLCELLTQRPTHRLLNCLVWLCFCVRFSPHTIHVDRYSMISREGSPWITSCLQEIIWKILTRSPVVKQHCYISRRNLYIIQFSCGILWYVVCYL